MTEPLISVTENLDRHEVLVDPVLTRNLVSVRVSKYITDIDETVIFVSSTHQRFL